MKLRLVAPLAIAVSAAAIGLAPIASADVSVHETPGNAQVTATPGAAAQEAAQNQQPFGGDTGALLFHHWPEHALMTGTFVSRHERHGLRTLTLRWNTLHLNVSCVGSKQLCAGWPDALAMATVGTSPGAETGSIGLGFSIPVDHAKRVADELIATGKAPHAHLGVQVTDATSPAGARTVGVTDGGAAAAGLPVAAVVPNINDRVIDSADALGAAVLSHPPADTVSVRFIAPTGGTRTAHVTLGTGWCRTVIVTTGHAVIADKPQALFASV